MATERDYIIHPLQILITLVLGSITALFVGFSGAYLYTKFQTGAASIKLPMQFYLNSIFLLGGSYTLIKAKQYYLMDQTERYQRMLFFTIVLTFLFLVAQMIAWNNLLGMNIKMSGSNMGSYLYVISGLHFVHVVAGIPFLAVFLYMAKKKMKEPVSVLVYFSDPNKRRKLGLLTTYWHYLDVLWIYLLVFFGVCQLLD